MGFRKRVFCRDSMPKLEPPHLTECLSIQCSFSDVLSLMIVIHYQLVASWFLEARRREMTIGHVLSLFFNIKVIDAFRRDYTLR